MEHAFTSKITDILKESFGELSQEIFQKSELLQYVNLKTRSANKGSKSRGSFANLYAIYVLLEDYINQKFNVKGSYSKYEGAKFSYLFKRQRELPFGSRLQNHALNHRMNEEFRKFFPTCDYIPILRNVETNRYWFNEYLIKIDINKKQYNIALSVIQIINEYVQTKKDSFELFITTCNQINNIYNKSPEKVKNFIIELLAPNIDARIFEIVSFSILKYYYYNQKVYFGFELNSLEKENLKLFKTGRTNANDGGIDFVMKPLGRFYQVTETLDFKKYFLDIDKIERYPITFVIKSIESEEILKQKIEDSAKKSYLVDEIVQKYMSCIEEIFNISKLLDVFDIATNNGNLKDILDEIIKQSKIEFNYVEEELIEEDEE